jgi:hypothetical protein
MGADFLIGDIIDPDDLRRLETTIHDFNVQATGISDGKPFASFLRDSEKVVVGGISGWTWGNTCFIAYLFGARSYFALMIRVDKELYLVGVSFLKARPTGCSRKIAFADGTSCKAVESINKTQHVGHKDVGYGKGPGQPFSLSEHVFHVLEASIEEFVDLLRKRRIGVVAARKLHQRPGQARHFNGIQRRKHPFGSLATPPRISWHHLVATVADVKQDSAALEDRDVTIRQPRYLTKWLMQKMLALPALE